MTRVQSQMTCRFQGQIVTVTNYLPRTAWAPSLVTIKDRVGNTRTLRAKTFLDAAYQV